jgi:hydrogenase 3 maturation protease
MTVVMTRYDVEKELVSWLSRARRVVIAGIGNPIRMDDFIGVEIVRRLHGKLSENVYLVECETMPESFTQQIVDFNPTHILLIDAAIFGLRPGESRLVKPEELTHSSVFSTHMLPLRIFCEYVANTTKAETRLLLIEPEKTDFGEGLTSGIRLSAKHLADSILKALQSNLQ